MLDKGLILKPSVTYSSLFTPNSIIFSFIAEDNLWFDNSNIKVLIKSYTSSHYQTEVSCICAYSENHEYNSMLQTLLSKTNFLETSFLNKLILHSFQFIICTNIPHRVLDRQQKRNLSLYNKGFQNFCVKLCYRHYKKINLKFFVFTRHFFPSELTIQT